MAVLNVKHGWAPVPAIVAGLAVGAAIGAINGFFVTRFDIPSFVVTLAGLLAWQGVQLEVLGDTGTVNLNDDTIVGLANTFYSDTFGWILAIVVIAAYGASGILERMRRAPRRAWRRRRCATSSSGGSSWPAARSRRSPSSTLTAACRWRG